MNTFSFLSLGRNFTGRFFISRSGQSLRSGKLAPGCLLMICVGVVVVLSTVWLLIVGNAQYQKIREFTQTSPQWTEVVEAQGEEKDQINTRVRSFIAGLDNAQEASILLTPKELAQCIALYKPLESLRSTITPREIVRGAWQAEGREVQEAWLLRVDACYKLNKMFPWQEQPYFIGTMDLRVHTSQEQGGPRIEVVSVQPLSGEMPQEMIDVMNQMDPFLGGLRDEVREPRGSAALEMIQFVEVVPEGVILATSQEAAAKMEEEKGSAEIPVREN